ncbi:SanA/YdcF family protein [Pinibacter aurantiacus]|uniref:YdcF family protein n=1 Tax=Pinibacter aurantiacus TaxID=2851599 RepID=A0A9E2SER0_9BACT|nr:ElyC/SanA/YdcF family protein [Pinibacter aurantiacus]MBV4359774.1 YdcF family protein [Pinibacter aurantiacus]
MIKKIIWAALIAVVIAVAFVFLANASIKSAASNKLYNDTASIPYNKVGLLLGCSKLLSNGYPNLYYQYRIDAAADLLKAGKIKYLVISGDNGRKEYNEPEDMRNDLIGRGIDSSVIILDYAGFRTFDSVVRLKEIFGQQSVTVISQQFHNERAIFIAEKEGIDAIGYNAKDVVKYAGFKTKQREKLARCKAYIDYLIGTKPRYLGEKIRIE